MDSITVISIIVSVLALGFVLGLVCLASYLVATAAEAASAGSAWVSQRRDQHRQRAALSQAPAASLLRAGEAPADAPEVLVRPVVATESGVPELLLRSAQNEEGRP